MFWIRIWLILIILVRLYHALYQRSIQFRVHLGIKWSLDFDALLGTAVGMGMHGGGHGWSYRMLVGMPFSGRGIGGCLCGYWLRSLQHIVWCLSASCSLGRAAMVIGLPGSGFRGRGVCWGLVGSSVSLMGQWPRGWLQAAGHADILFSSGYMCMCNFCGWYNVSLLFICAGRWARFAWCYNDVSVGFDGLGLCSLLVMSCLTDSNLWLQYLSRLEAIECWKIIKQFY